MSDAIHRIRQQFHKFIIEQDITLQRAAELVGWKRAASVYKFLAGKHRPNARRLYRIKELIKKRGGE